MISSALAAIGLALTGGHHHPAPTIAPPAAVVEAVAAAPVETVQPTITVVANCDTITVTTAGFPEGSHGIVGIAIPGPGAAPINGTIVYPVQNPYNVGGYRQGGDVGWAVDIWTPDVAIDTADNAQHQAGVVTCP